MATLSSGAFLAYNGVQIAGGIISTTGLVGLVSAFIYGTKERRKERETKFKRLKEKQINRK